MSVVRAAEHAPELTPELTSEKGSLHEIRGQTLYAVTALFIIVDLVHTFLTQGAVPGMTPARIAGVLVIFVFAACPVIYHYTGRIRLASAILLITAFAAILYTAWHNGGVPAPTLPFLTILPLAAVILINRVAGLISVMSIGAGLVFLFFSAEAGTVRTTPHNETQFKLLFASGMLLITISVAYLAFAYQHVAVTALQGLHDSNNKLVEQTALLKEQEQEILRQNTELEHFARVASHDLQAPLRQLMMLCNFLEEDLGEDISEEARHNLHSISSVSDRMRCMIKDILELTRMPADGLELQAIHPHALIEQAVNMIDGSSFVAPPDFTYGPMEDVMGEAVLLQQVYQNLITNALKFVPKGTAPSVTFTSERRADEVILGVQDNGIGIKEEDRKKIFEPLLRLHSRAEYEGSGIGLAICAKAVARMGGRIWVESSPTGGAHFKMALKAPH